MPNTMNCEGCAPQEDRCSQSQCGARPLYVSLPSPPWGVRQHELQLHRSLAAHSAAFGELAVSPLGCMSARVAA
eukprot:238772-Amphidinium_carterae.1